jgi:hypothetical protein
MEQGFLTPVHIPQNRHSMANHDYSGMSLGVAPCLSPETT